MEQKRVKVRLTENSPYSDYGYYEKGDIGYIDGYVNDNAVIILENGKFAKADLRWIEVVNEEDKNVNTELAEPEDEKIRKELIEYIRKTTCVNFIGKCSRKEAEKFISWLEKQGKNSPILSNSSNTGNVEQKPAAWSEEDRNYYDAIIAKLELTQYDALLTDNQMAFLKSLKDRVQFQSTWTPSEEQMRVVCYLAKYYAEGIDEPNRSIIKSLYEDLQKLK